MITKEIRIMCRWKRIFYFPRCCARQPRYLSSLRESRLTSKNDIEALPETAALASIQRFLTAKVTGSTDEITKSVTPPKTPERGYHHVMSDEQIRTTLDAVLATFTLHLESRIAAMLGRGFYTIGPCGEEGLSSAGYALHERDSAALHYRHLGINLTRSLAAGVSMPDLLLDRARGYTVSRHDPVTGGVHCSIGSTSGNDYIVTSTLASQCPPAVGRALGFAISPDPERKRQVSYVTIGDGSAHHSHFWSAFHLSRHARHKRVKCPVVFGISDNGLSISYSTGGYCRTLFDHDPLVPLFQANGNDIMDVYDKTRQAVDYSRRGSAPSVLLYGGLVRRFGHAATDRQFAYLTSDQIEAMANVQTVESSIMQLVEVHNTTTYAEVLDRLENIHLMTMAAFEAASEEEKVTRQDMVNRISPPTIPIQTSKPSHMPQSRNNAKKEVMRKHMTRVIDECLTRYSEVVYLGEDVEHGGYYLVSDGLATKHKGKVMDFPPDETSLLGAALGFAQCGLTPIVEIPYAKYLDCGADMFHEIAVLHWLSAGQSKQGMVIRLQGFDRGLFGGNFHTHNMLPHMPPGIDVVCYSNGDDYARGFRHAVAQARLAGRIVMTVDCTALLNLRHLHGKDRGWERIYPDAAFSELDDTNSLNSHDYLGFHEVRRYGENGRFAIISYGNGVVASLQSRKQLVESGLVSSENDMDVIDCPYLNAVPDGLRQVLPQYEKVVFADITKEGPGCVFSSHITSLHNEFLLPNEWRLVAAPRAYNPLGSLETFLSADDITQTWQQLLCQA